MDNLAINMYYYAMTDLRPTPDIARTSLPILLADHYAEAPGYRIQRPSGLKDWFLTFTNAGQGRYLWGSKEYICNRGDLVALPAGLPQDYSTASTDKNWEHYWVHFNPKPVWLRWLIVPESRLEPYICHISDSVSETRIVEDFEQLLNYYRTGQQLLAQQTFEDVLRVAVQQFTETMCGNADKRIVTIVQYLFQHLNESIDVPMLAEMVAMSPSRLAHLFKEQMHISIVQMLSELRLRYAVRLLRFTALSIEKIAMETGFQSQFYFSRRFKAHFGVGPKDYRKRLNEG
jgi:AraC family transcriptional regulator of arabinose operon